ncbi:PAAR domain-containing protein [uncultured Winogradskyella sp.]|uniref:PAAR domain-containing protein n=1 Tax=uncultured Winogradskyella sp. TaxID=395353 RepID=UPI0026119AF1|nr:PAAR domain-containing protein [uncultured Winogradskyella sp.]
MPPAARLTDLHTCPMQTPALVPIPHVGGPVIGPGMPNVLIGMLPAARVGDMLICVGPPDAIVKGSATVMIGGMPAARMGDTTAHGGQIVLGAMNVIIGG